VTAIIAAVGWIGGLLLASDGLPPAYLLLPSGVFAVLAAWRPRLWWLALLGGAAFLADVRFSAYCESVRQADLAAFIQRSPVLVRGIVAGDPIPSGIGVEFTVQARERERGGEWFPTSGIILVRSPDPVPYRPGDRILLEGVLLSPDPDLPLHRSPLRQEGILAVANHPTIQPAGTRETSLLTLLADARRRAAAALARALPEPEAGLARGITLGERRTLGPALADDFSRTNTSHILAVDGYKVGLVASVVEGVLGLFLRSWLATIGTVIGLGLYAVLVGTSPSALRATIMGALYLIGRALGRPRDTLNGLAVAALLMTMINPFLPWHLAFQLSFVTTLGLAALVPIVERWLPRHRGLLQEGVREALGATAAAEIASAPLVITAFNHVSLVSLPVHAVVMPLLPLAIALSALTAVTGSLVPVVGNLLGLLAWIPLTVIIRVVHGAAALPGAALAIPRLGVEAVVAVYGVLGLVVLARPNPLTGPGLPLADLWRRATATVPARLLVPALVLPCLLAGAILVSPPVLSKRITMLEVGMGDAALIETASGAHIYIQADAGADQAARALGPMLPFWNRSLALSVLTLGDDRELAELTDLIGRLEMRRVIVPSRGGAVVSRDRLQEAARTARTEILRAEPGLRIRVGETDSLEIYPLDHPAAGTRLDGSPSTLAVRLLLGRAMILWISSDPADQAHLAALGVPLSAQVLKLAGTGARWGVDPTFFARVNPSIIILPAGAASRFSRPTPGTLDLLAGRTVLRTDQDGAIIITAGENGLTVQTER